MFIFLSRFGRLLVGTAVVIAVTSVLGLSTLTTNAVPVASHHNSNGSSTSTPGLVLLNSTDGLPHYGQNVTFAPSTTVTTRPYVRLDCYQNQVWVYSQWAGFYPDFPWPWLQTYTLSNSMWTSGAADCTATLYEMTSRGEKDITSTKFHVYA